MRHAVIAAAHRPRSASALRVFSTDAASRPLNVHFHYVLGDATVPPPPPSRSPSKLNATDKSLPAAATAPASIANVVWRDALRALADLPRDELDLRHFNFVLSMLAKRGMWRHVDRVWAHMAAAGIAPSQATFTALLGAAMRRGDWEEALAVVDDMQETATAPNAVNLSLSMQCFAAIGPETWAAALTWWSVSTAAGSGDFGSSAGDSDAASTTASASGHAFETVLDLLVASGRYATAITLFNRQQGAPMPLPPGALALVAFAAGRVGAWSVGLAAASRSIGERHSPTATAAIVGAAVSTCSRARQHDVALRVLAYGASTFGAAIGREAFVSASHSALALRSYSAALSVMAACEANLSAVPADVYAAIMVLSEDAGVPDQQRRVLDTVVARGLAHDDHAHRRVLHSIGDWVRALGAFSAIRQPDALVVTLALRATAAAGRWVEAASIVARAAREDDVLELPSHMRKRVRFDDGAGDGGALTPNVLPPTERSQLDPAAEIRGRGRMVSLSYEFAIESCVAQPLVATAVHQLARRNGAKLTSAASARLVDAAQRTSDWRAAAELVEDVQSNALLDPDDFVLACLQLQALRRSTVEEAVSALRQFSGSSAISARAAAVLNVALSHVAPLSAADELPSSAATQLPEIAAAARAQSIVPSLLTLRLLRGIFGSLAKKRETSIPLADGIIRAIGDFVAWLCIGDCCRHLRNEIAFIEALSAAVAALPTGVESSSSSCSSIVCDALVGAQFVPLASVAFAEPLVALLQRAVAHGGALAPAEDLGVRIVAGAAGHLAQHASLWQQLAAVSIACNSAKLATALLRFGPSKPRSAQGALVKRLLRIVWESAPATPCAARYALRESLRWGAAADLTLNDLGAFLDDCQRDCGAALECDLLMLPSLIGGDVVLERLLALCDARGRGELCRRIRTALMLEGFAIEIPALSQTPAASRGAKVQSQLSASQWLDALRQLSDLSAVSRIPAAQLGKLVAAALLTPPPPQQAGAVAQCLALVVEYMPRSLAEALRVIPSKAQPATEGAETKLLLETLLRSCAGRGIKVKLGLVESERILPLGGAGVAAALIAMSETWIEALALSTVAMSATAVADGPDDALEYVAAAALRRMRDSSIAKALLSRFFSASLRDGNGCCTPRPAVAILNALDRMRFPHEGVRIALNETTMPLHASVLETALRIALDAGLWAAALNHAARVGSVDVTRIVRAQVEARGIAIPRQPAALPPQQDPAAAAMEALTAAVGAAAKLTILDRVVRDRVPISDAQAAAMVTQVLNCGADMSSNPGLRLLMGHLFESEAAEGEPRWWSADGTGGLSQLRKCFIAACRSHKHWRLLWAFLSTNDDDVPGAVTFVVPLLSCVPTACAADVVRIVEWGIRRGWSVDMSLAQRAHSRTRSVAPSTLESLAPHAALLFSLLAHGVSQEALSNPCNDAVLRALVAHPTFYESLAKAKVWVRHRDDRSVSWVESLAVASAKAIAAPNSAAAASLRELLFDATTSEPTNWQRAVAAFVVCHAAGMPITAQMVPPGFIDLVSQYGGWRVATLLLGHITDPSAPPRSSVVHQQLVFNVLSGRRQSSAPAWRPCWEFAVSCIQRVADLHGDFQKGAAGSQVVMRTKHLQEAARHTVDSWEVTLRLLSLHRRQERATARQAFEPSIYMSALTACSRGRRDLATRVIDAATDEMRGRHVPQKAKLALLAVYAKCDPPFADYLRVSTALMARD